MRSPVTWLSAGFPLALLPAASRALRTRQSVGGWGLGTGRGILPLHRQLPFQIRDLLLGIRDLLLGLGGTLPLPSQLLGLLAELMPELI